jgi:hypothetical protein
MPPTAEEFARWRDDGVTQWVMRAVQTAAEQNKAAWMKASWENGAASPALLQELRTRADAYLALAESPYETWAEWNGDEAIYDAT